MAVERQARQAMHPPGPSGHNPICSGCTRDGGLMSMWRNRPRVRGLHVPFPDPVEVSSGMERFRREDIVEWLERTGRGNNREANLDAPALSVPDDVPLDELVTWLCLAVL